MAITIKNGAKVLYQWERGVALTVTAPCDVLRVSREEEQRSVDLFPTWSGNTGTVLIPDRMLTESGYLRAARIDKGDGEERVIERVRIIIRAAQKPENDASSQREIRDWEELRIRMAALERAAREGKFDGEDGTTPHIGENGNWYIGDTDTGVNAKGDDGLTPHIGENGNWFIGETDTGAKAKGDDGLTPHIGENGNWYIGGVDTGVKAKGDDGITPHIGENGNWYIGDVDTGVKARSENVSEYAQDLVTNGVYVADDPDAMLCKPVEGTETNNPIRFRAEPGVLYINGVRKKIGAANVSMKSPEQERKRAFGYRLYEETGVIRQIMWDVEITTGADGNEIITAIGYDPDFLSTVLPVREGGIYDILIYTVTVPAGATQATQDMIRDLRGDERYCGFVRSKLDESVEIDATLTVSGAAADAAAVGAELKNKYSTENEPPYPVTSVCGKTGAVSLAAEDVGARPNTWTPSAEDVGADKSGTADGKVSAHNTSETSHNDIRLLISGLTTRLNALADSDDTTLDQLSEIVVYIKANKTLIDSITISKVNVADIIDNLTTSVSNKPLSAKMGVELKKLIDAIEIPTSLPASDVYDWAKQPSKPTYTKTEVELGNVDNVKQYSASNPPPYPVTSVNGQTGTVSVTADGIGAASKERVDQLSTTKVDITELFETAESNNYADMSALKIGMVHTNGKVYTGGSYDNYCYFENYIPVDEGDVVSLQFTRVSTGVRYWSVNDDYPYASPHFHRVAAYDVNKNILSASGVAIAGTSFAVPTGVKFIRVTFEQSLFYNADDDVRGTDFSIVKNATSIMPYEEYGTVVISTIKDKYLPNSPSSNGSGIVYISLPDVVHVKVGNTFTAYYSNILSRNDVLLWLGSHTSLTTRYYDEYFTVVASAAGSFKLPWKVLNQAGDIMESGTLTVEATTKVPTETTKAIVIGDSTVNDGTMTNKAIDLYAADGATLALYGTRGSGKHEGRGGWTAKAYCTTASSGDIENPFYNNGFDFSYYMANQGYSGIQAVAIQLGINDIFQIKGGDFSTYDSSSILDYIDQMVTSILAYDSTIKVIINLPTTPNSNGTSFTETYGTSQICWFYNHNIIRFAKELKDYFANNSSVVISASNCILDTKTQIRDGVHPTSEGYNALGQRLYEVLISIVDGVAVVVPLLDVSARTFVRHTDTTISATGTRELSGEKCYTAAGAGTRSSTVSNRITSFTPTSSNSFTMQVSNASGYGVEFPLPQLEAGKTYTIEYTVDNTADCYILKFNADTTYNSRVAVSGSAATKSKSFAVEEGFIYAIWFAARVADVLVTFSDISLTENT